MSRSLIRSGGGSLGGGSGSGTPEIEDWIDLGNLGPTVTIAGAANIVRRRKGTLDQPCAITLTTTANQQIELQLIQDGTGGRAATFVGVNVWATYTGSAPVLTSRLAGAGDTFRFVNVGGIVTGYWETESALVAAAPRGWKPTGAIAETFSRLGAAFANQAGILASGRLQLVGLQDRLIAGQVINTITFVSSTTAAATPLNQWFGLFDKNRNRLALTVDDTVVPWSASASKSLAITGGYVVPVTDDYYIGLCVVATTVPSLGGVTLTTGTSSSLDPITCGSSTTGLTNPASCPATVAALTLAGGTIYGFVS